MTTTPPIDAPAMPADVRNAGADAQKLYSTALAFEKVLVEQLTKELDASKDGGSSDDGSSDDSSDASTAMAQQMLPGAFAQGITDAGGVGLADQLYRSLKENAK